MTHRKTMKKSISILFSIILVLSGIMATAAPASGASYNGKYWIKVNQKCNVITVYEKQNGKWAPVRAMLCSVGLGDTTPSGTFYTKGKWNWGTLMNDVYGQYCTHITEDILFHSVYYLTRYDKSSQLTSAFNSLGKTASHGCVRLSVMDAKWIYDNCAVGTKVTIYSSSNPGPLGKPTAITTTSSRYTYWDPTDPDEANPNYQLLSPVITVSAKKKTTVQYGSKYSLTSGVTAQDPNTFMDLTDSIKVSSVKKYSAARKAYVKSTFSTSTLGTYKVTYKVKDPYSGTSYKTVKIKVVDNLKAPVISGAKNRTVTWGDKDAVGNVTAKQATVGRTKSMTVYIKAPGASTYKAYSYTRAKAYRFSETGKYKVKYTVKNKYAPYKSTTKTITITSKAGSVNEDPVLTLPERLTELEGQALTKGTALDLITDVAATHDGKDVTSRITVAIQSPGSDSYVSPDASDLRAYAFEEDGLYKIRYTIKNRYTPYQRITAVLTLRIGEADAADTGDTEV